MEGTGGRREEGEVGWLDLVKVSTLFFFFFFFGVTVSAIKPNASGAKRLSALLKLLLHKQFARANFLQTGPSLYQNGIQQLITLGQRRRRRRRSKAAGKQCKPGFLTVVLTAYPLCSSILTSAEAMDPFPPVTHAVLAPPVATKSAAQEMRGCGSSGSQVAG